MFGVDFCLGFMVSTLQPCTLKFYLFELKPCYMVFASSLRKEDRLMAWVAAVRIVVKWTLDGGDYFS